jgi:hypothetical protein
MGGDEMQKEVFFKSVPLSTLPEAGGQKKRKEKKNLTAHLTSVSDMLDKYYYMSM